jgi:hypothetical protein
MGREKSHSWIGRQQIHFPPTTMMFRVLSSILQDVFQKRLSRHDQQITQAIALIVKSLRLLLCGYQRPLFPRAR